ncbi:MAG: hypothetical protein WBM76_15170 [Woeseiaceae bacterium]
MANPSERRTAIPPDFADSILEEIEDADFLLEDDLTSDAKNSPLWRLIEIANEEKSMRSTLADFESYDPFDDFDVRDTCYTDGQFDDLWDFDRIE